VSCWGRFESGVNDGGGVVGLLQFGRVVSKCLLNVIHVGWRFESVRGLSVCDVGW